MTNASRAPVDLDALARDLRPETAPAGAARPAVGGAQKGDPLAELARIVGQDDPFRALLATRNEVRAPEAPQAAWDGGRVEPSFNAAPPQATPADAFDQYLASVERDTHEESGYGTGLAQAGDGYADERALRRSKPRRRLASVAGGVAVVAVAVTGALAYKAMHGGGSSGGVPVVQADPTPLKVAPKVADGVEIPDQNRQIYDRNRTKDGQIKIVNREEQPVDVAEAARAAQGPNAPSSQGSIASAGTTPGSGPFEAFGEPRRVRTVAVKPETPPAGPAREAPTDAGPSPIPTMVLPTDQAAAKPGRTARTTATTSPYIAQVSQVPAPTVPTEDAPATTTPVAAPKTVAAKPAKANQRVAAVAETPAQEIPATTAATSAPSTANDAVGGFSVQLGVRNSASDAKAALQQMQAKHARLAGKPELIRQAEVNGKTIYRVRVGPLAKAEAASLCSALQGEGGQCFVAKN